MADTISSGAEVAMADPSIPWETGECFWWNLPRELRDVVLKMVYGGHADFKIKDKRGWDEEQREAKNQAILLEKDFLTPQYVPYVSRILVGQQWFLEAKAAFLSSTHFDFSRGANPASFYSSLQLCFREVTEITTDMYSVMDHPYQVAVSLPHLKRMHLITRHTDFEAIIQDKRELHLGFDILTEQAVCAGPWYADFNCIRGLVQVTFSNLFDDMPRASDACTKRIRSNIELIKGALTRSLMRSGPSIVAEPEASRLRLRRATSVFLDLRLEPKKPPKPRAKVENRVSAAITDKDVPNSESETLSLVWRDPQGVAKWMVAAKKRLESSAI